MGFIPDIERICKLVPFTRQTLFFTATMPPEIQRITEQFLHNPVRVEVARPATHRRDDRAVAGQDRARAAREARHAAPADPRPPKASRTRSSSAIASARSRPCTARWCSHGFSPIALHGDMDQSARTAALEQFRRGEVKLLVASDVAARGLDIPAVSHVFNFDVPHHPDDYVHRIGRTGRAGTQRHRDHHRGADRQQGGGGDREADRPDDRVGRRAGRGGARAEEPRSASDPARRGRNAGTRARSERRHGGNRTRPAHRRSRDTRVASRVQRTSDPPPRSRVSTRRGHAARAGAPRLEEADSSHLPAFLLRPVTLKA